MSRIEEFGGVQDEQCCGAVAELERADPGEQPAEFSGEDGPDVETQLPLRLLGGLGGVTDRVDDGERGQQTGNDRRAIAQRAPTATTSPIAATGPRIAPRLSIDRSNP
ncbi:MAG: hypothetical protein WKF58_16105 [Ilumatobacteraceae bacterium]